MFATGFHDGLLATFRECMDLRDVIPFAERHHGLVTKTAARRAAISDSSWYRAVDAGLLVPIQTNVARLVGAPVTQEQTIMAAILAAGRSAVASHRTAAALWGIPRPEDDPIDILLDRRTGNARIPGVIVHRPRDHLDLKPVQRSGIPSTNVLRTLCDLGACDAAGVSAAVGHVLAADLASVESIDRAIARHSRRGRHGITALRAALQEWLIDGKPADSVLELAMRRLIRDFDLPPCVFHQVIEGHEVDFHLVDTPIIIECDGWTSHGLDRRQFQRDRERDAALTAAGYVVIRLTYRDVISHRASTARRIRAVVERWAPDSLDPAS